MKKIPTLFERRFENQKIVEVLPNITPGCVDAFLHGTATVKIDGSCCAIIGGKLYKRYDAKGGKPIPDGAIKCQDEPDSITGHLPCWVECNRDNPANKWFFEAYNNALKFNEVDSLEDGTYEAIGKHFQGDPYHIDKDVMEKHGIREVTVARTFYGVIWWLGHFYEEGLVFWLSGEPICKIKRSDFGFEWNKKGGKKMTRESDV